MKIDESTKLLSKIINRILEDKGEPQQVIDQETVILGGDLAVDSLDLAAIVVEMEGITGRDPFAEGFINFRTVGELANLYTVVTE